jgi:hypothetical protein
VAQPAAQVPVLDVSTDGYSGIKPGEIGFSGDGGYVVTGIIWSSWGPNGADGTGTSNIQGCVPDCATGSETPYTDTIVLSDPQGGQFTQVSSTRDGTVTAGSTSLIEDAAQNSPNAAPPVSTGTDPFTVVAEYFAAMGGQVNLPYAWSLLSSGEQTSMAATANGPQTAVTSAPNTRRRLVNPATRRQSPCSRITMTAHRVTPRPHSPWMTV